MVSRLPTGESRDSPARTEWPPDQAAGSTSRSCRGLSSRPARTGPWTGGPELRGELPAQRMPAVSNLGYSLLRVLVTGELLWFRRAARDEEANGLCEV